MPRGHVRWFSEDRGFGFIAVEGDRIPDLFVHADQAKEAGTLSPGDAVEFEIQPTKKGPAAVNVRRVVES